MTLSRDDLARIERLRELFLDDGRGEQALPDYWRDDRDLLAYDRVLGARIGWKWDAALAECRDRGFARADDQLVLDYGCGSGIAARAFVAAFGAREVRCFDRSQRAAEFACRSVRMARPNVTTAPLRAVHDQSPDVLLVSHVLGELDPASEQHLRALIARSQRVLIVEPGNHRVARRLAALRDTLLDTFTVLAPCPHALACPTLGNDQDWCHFFAAPPPSVFTDGDQVRTMKALGIDARALPYAFLALLRGPGAPTTDSPPQNRLLGRAELFPHTLRAQLCTTAGLQTVELQKRHHAELWRTVKKRPETVRSLPLA